MGKRNYLVEGVSGTGKSSVCRELRRRGYAVVDGDKALAYQGDPQTGEATGGQSHAHHIWDVERVKALVSRQDDEATFFCGGSRNFHHFIALFDEVFVLEVDEATLHFRLDHRPDAWGKSKSQRELIVRMHRTKEDAPGGGVTIDATQPLARVVDEIIRHTSCVPCE